MPLVNTNLSLPQIESSGDGSGDSEVPSSIHLSFPFPNPIVVSEDFVPMSDRDREDRILWRDTFGDLRRESEKAQVANVLQYINSDGMPEQFRRLTSEYLSEMVQLISKRLGMAPFNRQLNECTFRIPDQFYRLNYAAYDSLHHCPQCISDIGVKYVNAVHDLVLNLFNCLDSHIRL